MRREFSKFVNALQAIMRKEHFIPEMFQRHLRGPSDYFFVVYDENGSATLKQVLFGCVGSCVPCHLSANRKQEFESSALAGCAVHFYRALLRPHNAPYGGKAESAADKLRREERIEDLVKDLGLNPDASVMHL